MSRRKRVERFRIQKFKNRSGTAAWRVSGTMPTGRRVRDNFADKDSAIERRAELERESEGLRNERIAQKTILNVEQLSDAEAAVRMAGGHSLCELITKLQMLESRAETKGGTLGEAVRFFESHYRPDLIEISILQARDKFLQSKSSHRPATIEYYEQATAKLLKEDPNKPLHRFWADDIQRILNGFSNPYTVRAYRGGIMVFFNWAKRHRHCLENPCDDLDDPPESNAQIVILNLSEVKRLLTAAMKYMNGEMTAPIAIALFAGLRPSELEDLQVNDVKQDRIRVRGGKRREFKRTPPIPENLQVWLARFPFRGHPAGWQRRMRNLRRATKARRWVKDILRHTSISFQSERDKDEALTAYHNGTSKPMMERHYRDVIDDPEEVRMFWSLTPDVIEKENLAVTLPRKRIIQWPSDRQLAKLVLSMPMTHIGKQIGVSDVAVKKRCIARGIPLSAAA